MAHIFVKIITISSFILFVLGCSEHPKTTMKLEFVGAREYSEFNLYITNFPLYQPIDTAFFSK
ncbi:MAG: hypothetical protein ACK4K0_05210 [Flavobacteriales bacterium]